MRHVEHGRKGADGKRSNLQRIQTILAMTDDDISTRRAGYVSSREPNSLYPGKRTTRAEDIRKLQALRRPHLVSAGSQQAIGNPGLVRADVMPLRRRSAHPGYSLGSNWAAHP
jgi:hypothetical protein